MEDRITFLTGFDLLLGYVPFRRLLVYPGQANVEYLRASFEQALKELPEFNSSIVTVDGRPALELNTKPIFLVEKRQQDLPPIDIDHPLAPETDLIPESSAENYENTGYPTLQIKITQFNQHWVLGAANAHALCDGIGFWTFMQCWSARYQNQQDVSFDITSRNRLVNITELTDTPYDERAKLSRDPAILNAFIENLSVFTVTQFHIPAKQIDQQRIKGLSSNDLLSAVVWQSFTNTCVESGTSVASIFYDLRPYLDLGKIVGNCTTTRATECDAKYVKAESIAEIAQRIRKTKETLTKEIALKEVGYYEHEGLKPQNLSNNGLPAFSPAGNAAAVLGNGVLINNWSRFPIYDIQFGDKPIWFDMTTMNGLSGASVLPHPDGVIMKLFLPRHHIDEVKDQIIDFFFK